MDEILAFRHVFGPLQIKTCRLEHRERSQRRPKPRNNCATSFLSVCNVWI